MDTNSSTSNSTPLLFETLARLGALPLDKPYMLLAPRRDPDLERWMIMGQSIYFPYIDRFSRHFAEIKTVKQAAECNEHIASTEMPTRTNSSPCVTLSQTTYSVQADKQTYQLQSPNVPSTVLGGRCSEIFRARIPHYAGTLLHHG